MHTSTDFVLRGGDAAFVNRQKLLFDQLSIAENKCNKRDRYEVDRNDIEMHAEVEKCNKSSISKEDLKRRRKTRKLCGKESIFKRPEGRAPRASFRGVPDYHKNPHKWIKYSLADVSNEDMTERSNTQAAMSFLRELKARRKKEVVDEQDEKMDDEPCSSNASDCKETTFKHKKRMLTSQIVFRRPQTKETEDSQVTELNEKPFFRSSKIILPEYVIGQKPKISKQTRPVVKGNRSKELRLDHLQQPDEEEEEDN